MAELDPKPIVYAAIRPSTVAGRVSPNVRRLLSDVTCCRCGSAALATSTALAEMTGLAARTSRPLHIVCDGCVAGEKHDLMVMTRDKGLNRAASRDDAERN